MFKKVIPTVFTLLVSIGALGQNMKLKSPGHKYNQFEIFAGSWIPLGDVRILGDKFIAGFKVGGSKGKIRYYWVNDFRFGKSSNEYLVKYNDSTILSTDNFYLSLYSGLSAQIEMGSSSFARYFFSVGVGIDGFTALKKEPPQVTDGKSIGSMNYNFGFGYRIYSHANENASLVFEVSYNKIDYDNIGGSSMNGNTFSLRISVGIQQKWTRQTRQDRMPRTF